MFKRILRHSTIYHIFALHTIIEEQEEEKEQKKNKMYASRTRAVRIFFRNNDNDNEISLIGHKFIQHY